MPNMDHLIKISMINDFLYSPRSIYLHQLYQKFNTDLFHSHYQKRGRLNHASIDQSKYSTHKDIWQTRTVYSEKYGLIGKIDLFIKDKGLLIERKSQIKQIYLGNKYQLYAQMLCLQEMGHNVNKLEIHSIEDNKTYDIDLPTTDELKEFVSTLEKIRDYNMQDIIHKDFDLKARNSIYGHLDF
jgi:CRISPR-associated exonuclease Cas4